MREAIRLAVESVRFHNGGPFGAVLVRGDTIIGRGMNRVTATNDPTAHAEIIALREACRTLGTFRLEDCEFHVSCEPCPMCLGAIYWARIRRVFYACTRLDAADAGFDDDLIYREIALPPDRRALDLQQLLREEARPAFEMWKNKPDRIRY